MARFALLPQDAVELIPRLKPRAIKLMIALAYHMGPDGKCWPRRAILLELTGLSVQHFKKARKDLGEFGLEWVPNVPKSTKYFWFMFNRNGDSKGAPYGDRQGVPYESPQGPPLGHLQDPPIYKNRSGTNQKQNLYKTAAQKTSDLRTILGTNGISQTGT